MVLFQSIEWPDPGYANVLSFEYPGHRPMPRREWVGERASATSGYVDAWTEAEHEEFEVEFRRIPGLDQVGATGYHGAAGVKAFLAYANGGGIFRLNLNRDDTPATTHSCQLVETARAEREDDKAQHYRMTLKVRDVAGTEFVV